MRYPCAWRISNFHFNYVSRFVWKLADFRCSRVTSPVSLIESERKISEAMKAFSLRMPMSWN